MFGFDTKREKRRWNVVVYVMKDENNLESCGFSLYSSSRDKKDLIDMALRDWQLYWHDHHHRNASDWVIVDVWEVYAGSHTCLYARRYSRRCPAHIRCIADDSTLLV